MPGHLHDYWRRYTAGDLTTAQLLSHCSHVMPIYTIMCYNVAYYELDILRYT